MSESEILENALKARLLMYRLGFSRSKLILFVAIINISDLSCRNIYIVRYPTFFSIKEFRHVVFSDSI